MAKKSGLSDLGVILALIGGIIMVVYGILRIVGVFVAEANDILSDAFDVDLLSGNIGGENGVLIRGIIALVLGLVVIWVWKERKASRDGILLWGIVFIVIGLIGGSPGGLLLLIGGILLVIDYFA
ncbi:MAG: hypothetical protein HeimC3_28970 [Candidatus Heimdallarchaeota archaeon LC_3]|nr:MAG: hypothetical protein HeimC3_28970 [Candidatus Heimdallarchaeota archaeon LC_3]